MVSLLQRVTLAPVGVGLPRAAFRRWRPDGVHIRCCGNGRLWFRPYGDSLFTSARNAGPEKSKQKTLAPAYGPSLTLGVPSLRHPSGDIAYGLLRCTSSRCVRLRRTALRAHSPDECLHSAFRRGGWIKSLQGELTLGLVVWLGWRCPCGSGGATIRLAREGGRPAGPLSAGVPAPCRSEHARDGRQR